MVQDVGPRVPRQRRLEGARGAAPVLRAAGGQCRGHARGLRRRLGRPQRIPPL